MVPVARIATAARPKRTPSCSGSVWPEWWETHWLAGGHLERGHGYAGAKVEAQEERGGDDEEGERELGHGEVVALVGKAVPRGGALVRDHEPAQVEGPSRTLSRQRGHGSGAHAPRPAPARRGGRSARRASRIWQTQASGPTFRSDLDSFRSPVRSRSCYRRTCW